MGVGLTTDFLTDLVPRLMVCYHLTYLTRLTANMASEIFLCSSVEGRWLCTCIILTSLEQTYIYIYIYIFMHK